MTAGAQREGPPAHEGAQAPEAEVGSAPGPGRLVVLVHGLGRTWRAMRPLERHLSAAGYRTHNWDYPGRKHSLAELAGQLRRMLAETYGQPGTAEPVVDFVTHSLGGLLVRGALADDPPVPPGRIVMIAPPNQGVRLPAGARGSRLLRWLYGKPLLDIAAPSATLEGLGVPDAAVGVIAGVRRFHPVNPAAWAHALTRRDTEHDGTVEVERTKLAGMADFIRVDAHHTFICDAPEVLRQTLHFLQTGGFDHGVPDRASGDPRRRPGDAAPGP